MPASYSSIMNSSNGDVNVSNATNGGVEEAQQEGPKKSRKTIFTRILIGAVIVGFIIYIIIDSRGPNNVKRISQDFLRWIQENPLEGVFAFIGVYVLTTVLFIPGSLLTLGAGFVFGNTFGVGVGVLLATVAVFVGASTGAVLAFLVGRYLLRDSMEKLSRKFPVFEAIDSALGTNGFRIVLLLRLSPIVPFNAINYILGTTAVALRQYVLACVGMLPGTILYVFIGSSAGSIADLSSSSGGNKTVTIVVIVVGVIFGLGAVTVATVAAKKELNRIVAAQKEESVQNEEDVEEVVNV